MSQPVPTALPGSLSDRLREAREGSREAIGKSIEACRDYLMLVARRQVPSDLCAKVSDSDLVQDAFLEAQRDFAQFNGETELELRLWLCRILLNNASHLRRYYKESKKRDVRREVPIHFDNSSSRGPIDLTDDISTPSMRVQREEFSLAVKFVLKRLSERERRIVVLRNQDQLTFIQISQRLGCSETTVKNLWSRAVNRMERELRLLGVL